MIVCEGGGRELFRVHRKRYVTLTVDHRVLDGQQTNAFLIAFSEIWRVQRKQLRRWRTGGSFAILVARLRRRVLTKRG